MLPCGGPQTEVVANYVTTNREYLSSKAVPAKAFCLIKVVMLSEWQLNILYIFQLLKNVFTSSYSFCSLILVLKGSMHWRLKNPKFRNIDQEMSPPKFFFFHLRWNNSKTTCIHIFAVSRDTVTRVIMSSYWLNKKNSWKTI